jgi:transcriptional regulator with XRE-family HTH domain
MSEEVNEVESFLSGVGQRIQKIREFRGLTRKQLGEAIGLHGNSANTGVYAIEVGGAATRIDTVYKVAKILGVTPGFLLDGGDLQINRVETF